MAVARVKWVEDNVYLGVDANGRATLMSSGEGPGVSPMQMLLLGLGGCSLVDIIGILFDLATGLGHARGIGEG